MPFGVCFHCDGALEIAVDGLPIAHEHCQRAAGLLAQLPPSTGPALQIAALTTVREKMQDQETRSLKRKLEETTLAMERARMEREDFRQGMGPCYMANEQQNCTWRRRSTTLQNEALDLKEEKDALLSEIAVARNALDNFFGDTGNVEPVRVARRVLNNALPLADSD